MSEPLDLPDGISLASDGSVTFSGKSGRVLLLGLLVRAKFSRPLERHMALNKWVADLASDLGGDRPKLEPGEDNWEYEFRREIVSCILADAAEGVLPWWTMSEDERLAFVRDVAFAPHPISKFNAEEIVLMVQDEVRNAESLVNAVAKATGK